MKIPDELAGILVSTEDTLSGAVRFVDTRVHVQILFDMLLAGEGIDEFLEDFPNVSPEHARAVMEWVQNQTRPILGLDKAS